MDWKNEVIKVFQWYTNIRLYNKRKELDIDEEVKLQIDIFKLCMQDVYNKKINDRELRRLLSDINRLIKDRELASIDMTSTALKK